MGTHTLPDPIYRAALLAARDIESGSAMTRMQAGLALATTLDRLGVSTHSPEKNGTKTSGLLEVGPGEGILVAIAGDDKPADPLAMARVHHWQRVHLITYAARAVTIRTLAA